MAFSWLTNGNVECRWFQKQLQVIRATLVQIQSSAKGARVILVNLGEFFSTRSRPLNANFLPPYFPSHSLRNLLFHRPLEADRDTLPNSSLDLFPVHSLIHHHNAARLDKSVGVVAAWRRSPPFRTAAPHLQGMLSTSLDFPGSVTWFLGRHSKPIRKAIGSYSYHFSLIGAQVRR